MRDVLAGLRQESEEMNNIHSVKNILSTSINLLNEY